MRREEFTICSQCFAVIPSDLGAMGWPTGTNYQQLHAQWHAQQIILPVQQFTGTTMEPMPDREKTWC